MTVSTGGGGGGGFLHEGDENSPPSEDESKGSSAFDLLPGDLVDAFDSAGKWCEAQILQVNPMGRSVYVTYLFWGDKFNEWISVDSRRLAPDATMTYRDKGVLRLGHRIEAQDPEGKWFEADVIAEYETMVRVHYKNWATKFDEDLPRNSPRIRSFGRFKRLTKAPRPVARTTSLRVQAQKDRTRGLASTSSQFERYQLALGGRSLQIFAVDGDGNCLFRSVAHQVYGDAELHGLVREKCMAYMESERAYFEPFVEGDMGDFLRYLAHKRRPGVWGDDPEIQAMSELYNRPAEIWAFDEHNSARVMRTFHEPMSSAVAMAGEGGSGGQAQAAGAGGQGRGPPMRLSYYGGGHYDSIVGAQHSAACIREQPGAVEDRRIAGALQRVAFEGSFEDGRQQSDRAATEAEELSLALLASRGQFDQQDDLEMLFSQQTAAALQQADAEATDRAMVMSAEQRELEEALARSTQQGSSSSSSSSVPGGGGGEGGLAASELEMALSASMGVDPELQHALEQSKAAFGGSGADDEDLDVALAMSMAEPKDAGIFDFQQGAAAQASAADLDEDAELQRAIELSAQALWQQGN